MIPPEHYHQLPPSAKFLYSIKIIEITEDTYGKQSHVLGYAQNRSQANQDVKALKLGNNDRKFVLLPV